MSTKCFPEEFKIDAVKQVTERGHPVAEVARCLGVSTNSMYHWLKRYGSNREEYHQEVNEKGVDIKRLQKALRRVTEERDIFKKPRTLPDFPSNVRLYSAAPRPTLDQDFM